MSNLIILVSVFIRRHCTQYFLKTFLKPKFLLDMKLATYLPVATKVLTTYLSSVPSTSLAQPHNCWQCHSPARALQCPLWLPKGWNLKFKDQNLLTTRPSLPMVPPCQHAGRESHYFGKVGWKWNPRTCRRWRRGTLREKRSNLDNALNKQSHYISLCVY